MSPITSKLVLVLGLSAALRFSKLFALFPFQVHDEKLKRNRFAYVYPTIFLLTTIAAISYANRKVVPGTQVAYYSDAINLTLWALIALFALNFIFTYTRHYSNLHEFEYIYEECVKIAYLLNYLRIRPNQSYKGLLVITLIHFFIVPLILICVSYVRLIKIDANAENHHVPIGLLSLTSLISSLVPNLFFASMLAALYFFRLINDKITNVMNKTKELEQGNRTPYQIQQQFCNLSDSLDAIAQVHLQLTRVTQRISDLARLNLLFWLSYKGCGIWMQAFTVYMYILGWISFANFRIPIEVFQTGIAGTLLWLAEMWSMITVCSMTMQEVNYFEYSCTICILIF